MKLAFIGGCLNKQIGLSPELSYHHILQKLLDSTYPINQIDILLGYYTSYNLMSQSTINLAANKSPDILFLFLRPFPFMPLNKLWIKWNTNKKKRKLHPALFSRKNMNWDTNLTNYSLDNALIEPRREKFGLRDVNLLLGLFLGLNKWAVRYLMNEIKTINNYCHSQNKKIILLSLPQNPESLLGNYICKRTNKKLKKLLKSIPFIDISFIGEDYFEPDGVHYNANGHYLLATTLYNYLSKNQFTAQIFPSTLQTQ